MGKTLLTIVAIAATVAIIVFAPELTPAFLTAAIGSSAAIAVTTAVLTLALGVALSFASKALGIGSVPKASQTGTPQVFRQSITDSFIIYGKRRVGGLLVFFHAAQSGSDHYRYFVIACAGHRCKDVVSFMLNDEVVTVDGSHMVTSGKYANAAWLWFQRGLASETANATFVSECGGNWTTDHKGNGVAAIYAKFKMTDAVVQAGMPNITAIIEGRDEIRDSRDASVGYTRNAALIFYDWMAMPREEGGFGAYDDEIPDDDWISAQANVCDETVNGNPRYAFDCYMTTGTAPGDVRDAMIVNMAGSYTYSGGKHLMRPGYWVPVSETIEEDDLTGALQISPFMTSDASANQIQGTYISPDDGYQGMPFTTWTRPGATDVRQLDLDLAFTTVLDQADRVAAIMGKRAACEKTVVVPMNIMGIKMKALDTVQLNSPRYSLNNYAWVVGNWGLTFDPETGPGVVLALREENEEIYDDGSPASPTSPPDIVQPDAPITTLDELQSALRSSVFPVGFNMTASDGGSSATVRMHGPTTSDPFQIDYPGGVDATIAAFDTTGLAYSTTYFPYADVASIGDTAPVFGLTAVYADAINSSTHPHRLFLGKSVTTPTAGGGTTTGGGGGGAGSFQDAGGGHHYPEP
jgi:hypothetical protein